jgi:hypothetical protein
MRTFGLVLMFAGIALVYLTITAERGQTTAAAPPSVPATGDPVPGPLGLFLKKG